MRAWMIGLMLGTLLGLGGCPADDDTGDDDTGDDDAGDDDAGDDDTTGDDDSGDDDSGDDDSGDDDSGTDDDTTGDDDTAPACGTIGQPCSDPLQCSLGETCYLGGLGGVCAPARLGCGGFAGATCDDPAAPICMYLENTDYGLCANVFEHDCICATSPQVMMPSAC